MNDVKKALSRCAIVASVAFLGFTGSLIPSVMPYAWAIEPPEYDPARDMPPPDGVPGPEFPMKQNTVCATSVVMKGAKFHEIGPSIQFGVDALHGHATGAGQTVAVIDSGVNPNVRLPRLLGGGDYIMGGDGLSDCDHHGTPVAGIIAAQPSPDDGFVGVAPDATILSIRQTSSAFTLEKPVTGYDKEAKESSNLATLARAIVHAANLGATVINLSVTSCVAVNNMPDLRELMGAVHYAAVVKNVVLVAAAGNTGNSSTCKDNPGPSPDKPDDERGWGNVQTISLPSLFSQYVLSVGGINLKGDPFIHSMQGPWVGVASPAINIVSLNPVAGDKGTLINGQIVEGAPTPLNGTSFSAAYVAGLAALIRQKYPELSAAQVIRRITYTAHRPSKNLNNAVGFGIVDSSAALLDAVDVGEWEPPSRPSIAFPAPPPSPEPDKTAQNIAIIAGGSVFGIAVIMLLARMARAKN